MKDTWVKYIKTMKSDPYIELRAKIALYQQYGREPTEDELTDALATGNKFKDIPSEVVLDAYLSGQRVRALTPVTCL